MAVAVLATAIVVINRGRAEHRADAVAGMLRELRQAKTSEEVKSVVSQTMWTVKDNQPVLSFSYSQSRAGDGIECANTLELLATYVDQPAQDFEQFIDHVQTLSDVFYYCAGLRANPFFWAEFF